MWGEHGGGGGYGRLGGLGSLLRENIPRLVDPRPGQLRLDDLFRESVFEREGLEKEQYVRLVWCS